MNDMDGSSDDLDWVVYIYFDSEELSVESMEAILGIVGSGRCFNKGDNIESLCKPYVSKGIRDKSRLQIVVELQSLEDLRGYLEKDVVSIVSNYQDSKMNAKGTVDILYAGDLSYLSVEFPKSLIQACAASGVSIKYSFNVAQAG
jgi:hypothetical protein